MVSIEITSAERVALTEALCEALNPLASAVRARETGLPEERMWDADPAEVALSVLAAWKVVDEEVERLTAKAARTAGAYGASYERMGAAWGITRQGARKKWPDAVNRSAAAAPEWEPVTVELFGGSAELAWDPARGGWRWAGQGADGAHGEADGALSLTTREEAAAHAGAFLKEHGTVSGKPVRGRKAS
ncbi:hypothetical protein [Streptomyces daliensis]|uniref:Uncharacterized protein n=1 Tax=Streptomyces daliensis TaxID=299421 RepID=A0A8T4IQ94_9ACTN|nr:hypothetical protein [Streptomyces daliensis]